MTEFWNFRNKMTEFGIVQKTSWRFFTIAFIFRRWMDFVKYGQVEILSQINGRGCRDMSTRRRRRSAVRGTTSWIGLQSNRTLYGHLQRYAYSKHRLIEVKVHELAWNGHHEVRVYMAREKAWDHVEIEEEPVRPVGLPVSCSTIRRCGSIGHISACNAFSNPFFEGIRMPCAWMINNYTRQQL